MSPVLIALSAGLLGRAHYVLYVLKRGTRTTTIITWLATLFVIGFWVWQAATLINGTGVESGLPAIGLSADGRAVPAESIDLSKT